MVLAVMVLLGAVAVLVVVLLLQPRAPYVAVRAASLYALVYGQTGALDDVQGRPPIPLAYVARAQGAPMGDAGSVAMEVALRDGVVPFRVEGEARTRWKVAGIVSVDQWTRLACQLRFFWPNDTVLPFRCSSKSKFLFFRPPCPLYCLVATLLTSVPWPGVSVTDQDSGTANGFIPLTAANITDTNVNARL
eukprot:XP_020406578.1 uncharacterized protein LOC103652420 [Zea mays]